MKDNSIKGFLEILKSKVRMKSKTEQAELKEISMLMMTMPRDPTNMKISSDKSRRMRNQSSLFPGKVTALILRLHRERKSGLKGENFLKTTFLESVHQEGREFPTFVLQ